MDTARCNPWFLCAAFAVRRSHPSHILGIKVAGAASAEDAYALLRAAAADPEPCIVIEVRALYASVSNVAITEGAEPVGKARSLRAGSDVAIVTWGAMVGQMLEAADRLSAEGIETSVLDLRWLSPLDEAALLKLAATVAEKILVVHEAVKTGGFAAENALRLRELCGTEAKLDIRRLPSPDIRMPAAPSLQAALIPDVDAIVAAARNLLSEPLPVSS